MKKLKEDRKSLDIVSKIGVFTLSLFVAMLAAYLYSPVFISRAVDVIEDEDYQNTKNLDVKVDVLEELSLTASSEDVEMSTTIYSFVHNSVDLIVKTNSLYGYTLAMEDYDDDTRLVHENQNVTDTLSSEFLGAKTSSTMDDNTWGFSLDNGANYYYVPENGMPTLIDRATSYTSTSVTKTVDFGAKLGYITAGVYEDTVIFTAYVNGMDTWPKADVDLYEKGTTNVIETAPKMQTFSCDDYENGSIMYVKDNRDGNVYTVEKFDDGNCWMTQNLRLVNKTLTPQDSNVSSNFTLKASSQDDYLSAISYVAANPELQGDAQFQSALANADAVYYDETKQTAYYTLYAATAGASGNVDPTTLDGETLYNYSSSICPAGWRIPSSMEVAWLRYVYDNGNYLPFRLSGGYVGVSAYYEGSFINIDDMSAMHVSSYGITYNENAGDGAFPYLNMAFLVNGYNADPNYSRMENIELLHMGGVFGFPVRCMNGTAEPGDMTHHVQ